MIDPLSRLSVKYGTDKFGPHDYTPKYHYLLSHLRDVPLRMMEIGVGGYNDPNVGGASLQVWRDYFRAGTIVGIDIEKKTLDLGPRISVEQGSQVDDLFLKKMIAQHGPFDIILDDGSHENSHVVESYKLLFEMLRPGGFYIVEDVQTAFFPQYGGSLELTAPNSVRFFADLMTALVEDRPEAQDIAKIWRFHNIVAIQKTGGAAIEQPEVECTMFAHVNMDEANIVDALAGMNDGERIISSDLSAVPEMIHKMFVEIDHREILASHPTEKISDLASQISMIGAQRTEVVLEKGRNDYPSNFDFDIEQPEARATLACYKSLLEEDPTEAGLQVYGKLAMHAGWQDEIKFAAEKLQNRDAQELASLEIIIRSAKVTDDKVLRSRTLRLAYELYPNKPNIIQLMADLLMTEGDFTRAEKVLLTARANGHETIEICALLGRVHLRKENFEDALAEGKIAIQIDPQRPIGWVILIQALMRLNQLAEAEVSCQQAISVHEDHVQLLILLSRIRLARSDVSGAQDALRQATEVSPENPNAIRLQVQIDEAQDI